MTSRSAWLDASFFRRTMRVGAEVTRFAVRQPRQFWTNLQQFAALQRQTPDSHLQYLNGLPSVAPLNLTVDPALAQRPHLNVLIPGVAMRAMSGGPNTLINVAYRIAAGGVPIRFISTDIPADRDHAALWSHFTALTGVERLTNVEICCAFDRSRPFAIGENDVFFASAWWNVQMIKRALPLTKPRRFLYIIQDYEPGLYPWSTEYALALETYSLDYWPLIGQKLLADFFVQHRVGRFEDLAFAERTILFEPAVDGTHFYPEPPAPDRPRRLLFYARPTTARRNLFELGLYALRCCAVEGVFSSQPWELLFIGEQLPPGSLVDGLSIRSAPWLGYAHYAQLLRQSDVVLSLMLSPHTSYPPLEMAACGGFAVTNTYANKTAGELGRLSPNIIGVPPTLEGVISGIKEAVNRVRSGQRAPGGINMPADWNTSLRSAVERGIEAYTDCLASGT